MARIRQYPHFLFLESPGESTQDANGDWTETGVSVTFLSMCREEKDGRGSEIATGGGEYHKVTSTIQCPASCPAVTIGSRVIVANDDECTDVRISGVVLNCDPAQLHTRIWV